MHHNALAGQSEIPATKESMSYFWTSIREAIHLRRPHTPRGFPFTQTSSSIRCPDHFSPLGWPIWMFGGDILDHMFPKMLDCEDDMQMSNSMA